MLKIKKISILPNYTLSCVFNTGEVRIFDLQKSLDTNNRFVRKILSREVFDKVKLGDFGELFWDEIGEIQELNGSISSCNYDISPEFVYANSEEEK
jgi:hypothetical protein